MAIYCFLVAAASASLAWAGEESSTHDNAKTIVSRYEGVWTAPPRRAPSNGNTDAPLLGNGDIGVLVGGAPEKQQFWISKCDFWRPQPYFPWFTPALVGAIDLEIPALKGAGYRAVQDIANAEVRQTFTQPDVTVGIRSWTPATGHELIVELSCTGKPVEISARPWTFFGNGATVATGQDADVHWLTRSFTSQGYDWNSEVTLAVSLPGSTAGTAPPAERMIAEIPAETSPVVLGGRQLLNHEKQQYSRPFQGAVHAVDLYDRVLSEEEIATIRTGGSTGAQPVFTTRHSDAGVGELKSDTIDGVPLGEVALAPRSFTMVLDVTPATAHGRILQIGEPGKGIVIVQQQRRSGYHLRVRAGGSTVGSLENIAPNKRILAIVTSDARDLLLHLDGRTTGTRRIDALPRLLTLQPGTPVRLVAAIRSNQEQRDFQAAAIKDAASLDRDAATRLAVEHGRWWRSFWNESAVDIGDPVLESYYYGSFYIMACCSRNENFAPSLFGNWASGDMPALGGDYHMNYNHQAPWWGCYTANHIALADPYDAPVLQFMERGKYMAEKYLGRKGVYYCVGIAPNGSCACWDNPHDGWNNDSPAHHFFAGQKCNALFGGINMAMRWNATLDPDYARKVYPYLREVATFWEEDLVWEDGRYSIVRDNIHEGSPAPQGEKNNPMSLGLLRSCLKATLEMSRVLGADAEKREKWQHMLDNLSDFTVFERNGRRVFRYSEEGRDFASINGVGLQHVYPADAIGLESSPDMLAVTHNTIEQHPQCWRCNNHTMSFYPGLARAGYDPDAILQGLHALVRDVGLQNFVIDRGGGGGIETCSTITATINEMLLQSHQGVIRVFPAWPKDKDARFESLRAHGAFLVTAATKDGNVRSVRIVSERGAPCTMRNPWAGRKVRLTRNGKPADELQGDVLKFATGIGETVDLEAR